MIIVSQFLKCEIPEVKELLMIYFEPVKQQGFFAEVLPELDCFIHFVILITEVLSDLWRVISVETGCMR